jgi:type IV pilus assembly protein PilP
MICNRVYRLCCLASSALFISACSPDISDLNAFIEQTRTKHVGSVEPLPLFQPYNNFIYSASELRDPFEAAFLIEDEEKNEKPTRTSQRPREPLEKFPLDTLRMVGTLEQQSQLWGLVKDPQSIVHRVRIGDHAGQNDGEIIAISEEKIEIVEVVPDGMGGYVERNAALGVDDK